MVRPFILLKGVGWCRIAVSLVGYQISERVDCHIPDETILFFDERCRLYDMRMAADDDFSPVAMA